MNLVSRWRDAGDMRTNKGLALGEDYDLRTKRLGDDGAMFSILAVRPESNMRQTLAFVTFTPLELKAFVRGVALCHNPRSPLCAVSDFVSNFVCQLNYLSVFHEVN